MTNIFKKKASTDSYLIFNTAMYDYRLFNWLLSGSSHKIDPLFSFLFLSCKTTPSSLYRLQNNVTRARLLVYGDHTIIQADQSCLIVSLCFPICLHLSVVLCPVCNAPLTQNISFFCFLAAPRRKEMLINILIS